MNPLVRPVLHFASAKRWWLDTNSSTCRIIVVERLLSITSRATHQVFECVSTLVKAHKLLPLVKPPSTGSPIPVTQLESSVTKNKAAFAISSTLPSPPKGCCASRRALVSGFSSMPWMSALRVNPGQSALTWIRWGAQSHAAARVNPKTACFVVTYAAVPISQLVQSNADQLTPPTPDKTGTTARQSHTARLSPSHGAPAPALTGLPSPPRLRPPA